MQQVAHAELRGGGRGEGEGDNLFGAATVPAASSTRVWGHGHTSPPPSPAPPRIITAPRSPTFEIALHTQHVSVCLQVLEPVWAADSLTEFTAAAAPPLSLSPNTHKPLPDEKRLLFSATPSEVTEYSLMHLSGCCRPGPKSDLMRSFQVIEPGPPVYCILHLSIQHRLHIRLSEPAWWHIYQPKRGTYQVL